jgi:NAD+--asparagine ADP-ribosyltransferase
MADISKLEQQADLLFNNVAGWEQSTLQRIGKRIGKYGKMSLADVKAINNIAVVKQDMDAITKELAKVTGYNISQIEQMYGELLEEQHLANQPLYDYRGKKFVPFSENRELQAIARAYAKTTGETMINLAKIGGSNLGFIDKNGKFKAIEKMYTEALDKAVLQVSTGATDFHTAMRDTIVEMGGSGIRINYADSGITRRLDTAVRQSLLWGAKQASVEYNEMIGQELGCDGIEIDYHSNPRPSHEIMQGKQYSIVGKKTINGVTYEDAYEQGVDGSGGLLNDYGCLHYKTPIILGISEPRYSEKELARLKEQDKKTYDIDGKQVTGYEATQMMRRLETAIRNEKSIKNMAQAGDSKKLVKDCNAKIKAYQSKYNEISEITGIQGDKKRMSVPRSTASVKGATPKQYTEIKTPKQADETFDKNWAKNLPIEQKDAISRYTGDYSTVNDWLRKTEDAQYIDGKRAEERIAQMDKAIKSFDLTEDIKVYRGIDRSALGNIEDLVGKEYIDQAYMSSSIFADNSVLERGDCVMELLIPKGKGRGAYINELSAFKDKEYEFLVARGSKFRVVSVGETNGKPLLRMEMIVDE